MRFASSRTLCLLGSAGALGVLAWSAEQGPSVRLAAAPPIRALNRAAPGLTGVSVQEVNRLLAQFEQAQKMMKMVAKGGMQKMLRGLRGGFPGMR